MNEWAELLTSRSRDTALYDVYRYAFSRLLSSGLIDRITFVDTAATCQPAATTVAKDATLCNDHLTDGCSQRAMVSALCLLLLLLFCIRVCVFIIIKQGFIQAPFGGKLPPKPRNFPQEFLASSDFLDNCLYNFRRDSLIVLLLFLSVSEQLLQVLFALLRAGFSGSANSTVLLKNHGNQILCEI